MKRPLTIIFVTLTLAACGTATGDIQDDQASSLPDIDITDDFENDIDATSSANTASSVPTDTGMDNAAEARVIEMTVDNWSFAPNAVMATTGEKIVVRLTGVEGQHSFAVPELGINVAIAPGETKDVEIPTDKAGTFAFRCLIPCGDGHRDMTGQIVIS